MPKSKMHIAPLHVLTTALGIMSKEDDGNWEHFLTSMSDDGFGVFAFDHSEDGMILRVETGHSYGYKVEVRLDGHIVNTYGGEGQ